MDGFISLILIFVMSISSNGIDVRFLFRKCSVSPGRGGWMNGWMGGWMDGWMDGWVDGWMDSLF